MNIIYPINKSMLGISTMASICELDADVVALPNRLLNLFGTELGCDSPHDELSSSIQMGPIVPPKLFDPPSSNWTPVDVSWGVGNAIVTCVPPEIVVGLPE